VGWESQEQEEASARMGGGEGERKGEAKERVMWLRRLKEKRKKIKVSLAQCAVEHGASRMAGGDTQTAQGNPIESSAV